jgi:hypothetical protein
MPLFRERRWLGWMAATKLAAVSACSLVTNFDPAESRETSDELCSDGLDNDGDGLADCQDWRCNDRPACFDVLAPILSDAFTNGDCVTLPCEMAAPRCMASGMRWRSWGKPTPAICDGGLVARKAEQCGDSGIISNLRFSLEHGLRVVVGLNGTPEPAGRLIVALVTEGATVLSSNVDRCKPGDTFEDPPLASVVLERLDHGFAFVAHAGDATVGVRPLEPAGDAAHVIEIAVDRHARVVFTADGHLIGRWPAILGTKVQLALAGRGRQARFLTVTVAKSQAAADPKIMVAAEPPLDLSPSPEGGWDDLAVSAPAIVLAGERQHLFYTGCALDRDRGVDGPPDCDSNIAGVGHLVTGDGIGFKREHDCPVLSPLAPVCPGGLSNPVEGDFSLHRDSRLDVGVGKWAGELFALASFSVLGEGLVPLHSLDGMTWSRVPGAAGQVAGLPLGMIGRWDAGELCCATMLERGGRLEIWYAGRVAPGSGAWQIGRAVSADGVTFLRDPSPVLMAGGRDQFDEAGVSEPSVVWDDTRKLYRMWYRGDGKGSSMIGLAVSTDGRAWHKFPRNPVLGHESPRLLGGPAVQRTQLGWRIWVDTPTDGGGAGRKIVSFLNQAP